MKKHLLYILTLLLWTSCDEKNVSQDKKTILIPVVSADVHELKKEEIITNSKNLNIREYGQKIIDGEIKPTDNIETFACLDSIDDSNADTRKFFFQVYRIIAQQSDGALSEVIGVHTKKYLQSFPSEAINNYKNLGALEQEVFINYLAYEFYASGVDNNADINEYFISIYNSCNDCKTEHIIIEKIKTGLITEISKING